MYSAGCSVSANKSCNFPDQSGVPSRCLSAARRVKGGVRHEARRATVTHAAR